MPTLPACPPARLPAAFAPPTPATGVWRLIAAALLACTSATWAQAAAAIAAPQRSACDAGHQTLLAGSPALPEPARAAVAVWLDGGRLRWQTEAVNEGRYRLLHAPQGGIEITFGAPARGARDTLLLASRADTGPLPLRYGHLGAGVTLALPDAAAQRLRQWHRGQMLLVREDASGAVVAATHLQAAGAIDALYAAAESVPDLGAVFKPQGAQFKVWAPTAQRVALCLFNGPDAPASALLPMHRDARTGIWRAAASSARMPPAGPAAGAYYVYLVDVFVPGVGLVRNRVTDPYSLSLNADSQRSLAVDLNAAQLKPPGWDATPRPGRVKAQTDMVIYELHVRDFSINDATVDAARRGKYSAFAEGASNGVKHLRALSDAGLTDVHLLPVFDLATVPERGCVTPQISGAVNSAADSAADSESQQAAVAAVADTDCYNWGYDPWHFTAPEGSFASDAHDGGRRIVEFRSMVQALHRMNLRVGMDMVYNHTTASGQHAKSVLDRIVPGYYHRLDGKGAVERSTCCDNTATEHRMMAKLMIDSAVVWARDYRIDSFRFDLMGHQPRDAMQRLSKAVDAAAGRHIQLIGEGWNFGEVVDGKRFVQASQLQLNGTGIGTFNDRLRDALRGGNVDESVNAQVINQGYLNGLHYDRNSVAAAADKGGRDELLRAADLVRAGMAGSIRSFVLQTHQGAELTLDRIGYGNQPAGYVVQPGEVVNYVENHDNATVFDSLVYKMPGSTSREHRARAQHLGNAFVAFSQGVAYFHAGQEMLRSKSMDRNSYDSGDWFNRIDWTFSDNYFGTGLPPRRDNFVSWPVIKPLLADASIKPTPAEIRWTRDAFLDLLKIRAGTALLRLSSADDIKARLRFHNTGPAQLPTVIAGHLDGRGLAGAGFAELLYLINVDKVAQTLTIDALKGRRFVLHPVHRAAGAADQRATTASYVAEGGRFTIPPRTAVVWVVD